MAKTPKPSKASTKPAAPARGGPPPGVSKRVLKDWPARLARLGLWPTPKSERTEGWVERSSAARRAKLHEVRRAAVAEEQARLQRIEDAKPRCPLCNQKLDAAAQCPPCETKRQLPYEMTPGLSWLIVGAKVRSKPVKVDARSAARAQYQRELRRIDDQLCGVFLDPKTKATYAQPVEEV